jgi:hypothetical protein
MQGNHERKGTEATMLTIRLPKADRAKAWRAMIEIAPVRLVADDPVYVVLPAHLDLLTARGFTYEVVPLLPRQPDRPDAWEPVDAIYRRLEATGRTFSDSADLLREDRDR